MILRILWGLSLLTTFCCVTTTHADVALTVETELVDAGDTALVGFFIASDTGAQLNSFNFPVDIGGADASGPGLGPFLSFNAAPVQNALAGIDIVGNLVALQNTIANSDVILNLTTPAPLALTATPVRLFDLVLDVAPDAPVGSIPISIDPTASFYQFNVIDSAGGSITVDGPVAGAVVISAVPEPSSLGFLAIVTLALGSLRRRRTLS